MQPRWVDLDADINVDTLRSIMTKKAVETTVHRKPEKDRKLKSMRIRVSEEDKKIFKRAADIAGVGISAWLRATGVRAAASLNRQLKASFRKQLSE